MHAATLHHNPIDRRDANHSNKGEIDEGQESRGQILWREEQSRTMRRAGRAQYTARPCTYACYTISFIQVSSAQANTEKREEIE